MATHHRADTRVGLRLRIAASASATPDEEAPESRTFFWLVSCLLVLQALVGCAPAPHRTPPKPRQISLFQRQPGVPVPVTSLPGYRASAPTTKGNTPEGAIFYGMAFVLSDHPFPFYPDEMNEKKTEGAARAVCTIQVDGQLTDCHIVGSDGSPAFGAALMAWLTSRGLLAHPLLLNGHPTVGTHEFAINFRLSGG